MDNCSFQVVLVCLSSTGLCVTHARARMRGETQTEMAEERQTDRQTDRDRNRDGWTDRQTETRQTDRQTETERDRDREPASQPASQPARHTHTHTHTHTRARARARTLKIQCRRQYFILPLTSNLNFDISSVPEYGSFPKVVGRQGSAKLQTATKTVTYIQPGTWYSSTVKSATPGGIRTLALP